MKEMLKGFLTLGIWCQILVIIDLIFMITAITIAIMMKKEVVSDYFSAISMIVLGTGLLAIFCQALWSMGREQSELGVGE